jgi:hypothetical protein
MTQGIERQVFYFKKKGTANTDKALDIALSFCREQSIGKIVVASSSGETALKCHGKAASSPGVEIIAVTYGAGSKYREEVEAFNRNHDTLLKKGVRVVRGIHALSGLERSFENRYKSGFIPLNLVADTLRMFSQGMKVCVEVSIMAAEAGYITPDEDVVAVGGSGSGADTAVLIRSGYAASMFDTRIKGILCMPVA